MFYRGHKVKIASIVCHPSLRVIATGEVNVRPMIHVWDSETMETIITMVSSHRGGIMHMTFSSDG